MRVWAMRTGPLSDQEAERLLTELPVTLQEKLRTMADPRRQQSLWAYSLLRLAVRTTCGTDLPEIAWSPGGKPYFAGEKELFFNLSHTEGAVLVGLSRREIGVDMEKEREVPVRLRCLMQTDQPFFAEWVWWEACAKCLGQPVLSLLRQGILPETVSYCAVETFPGYWAGVAVQGEEKAAEVRLTEREQVLA